MNCKTRKWAPKPVCNYTLNIIKYSIRMYSRIFINLQTAHVRAEDPTMMETTQNLVSQCSCFVLEIDWWSPNTRVCQMSLADAEWCKVVHTDHLVVETWCPQLFKPTNQLAVLEVHIEGIEQSRNTTNWVYAKVFSYPNCCWQSSQSTVATEPPNPIYAACIIVTIDWLPKIKGLVSDG